MLRALIKKIPFLYNMALAVKHNRWSDITIKNFDHYIHKATKPKLQLGAGLNELPGWFNTDYFARPTVFFLDVTKKFPFVENTFEYVFSEHHIEHITYLQAQYMLAETFRVMKPGGYIRIDTPNLDKYIQAYANKTLNVSPIDKHVKDWIYSGFDKAASYIPVDDYYEAHFINDIFLNYEHRFIYNYQALKRLLENAGFVNIVTSDQSNDIVEILGIESHSSAFDKQFTLSVIAQKSR